MANFKPQYTNSAQVKLYLRRKVDYGLSTPDMIDSLTNQQINAFIVNAESRVEIDLSRQYLVPFNGGTNTPFSELPQGTQVFIQEMCTWKAVSLILATYFGQSEGDRGKAFQVNCIEQYDTLYQQAAGINEHGQYLYPPLSGLALNSNAAYRTTAGAQAPKSTGVGDGAFTNSNITRGKLTNLNKSLLYGYGKFNK